MQMCIYDRIRQLRIKAGMSQDELAHAMGYKDRSMITKIESGKVDISQKKIFKFAEVLNTSPAYLMGIDEPRVRFMMHKIGDEILGVDTVPPLEDPLTEDEFSLLNSFRSLSPRGQKLLLERCEELKLLHGKDLESDTAESV